MEATQIGEDVKKLAGSLMNPTPMRPLLSSDDYDRMKSRWARQKQDDAQPLGHSPLHNSRHLNLNHGGGSHQAFKRGEIVWAWILTIPVTAFLAYWLQRLVMGIDIP